MDFSCPSRPDWVTEIHPGWLGSLISSTHSQELSKLTLCTDRPAPEENKTRPSCLFTPCSCVTCASQIRHASPKAGGRGGQRGATGSLLMGPLCLKGDTAAGKNSPKPPTLHPRAPDAGSKPILFLNSSWCHRQCFYKIFSTFLK